MDTEGNVFADQMTDEIYQGMDDCASTWPDPRED